MCLSGDFDYRQISASDQFFIEQQKFSITEIARFFNIPSQLLLGENNSYNSLEQANLDLYTRCISPLLIFIEEELTKKLCEDTTLRIDFNEESLLRTDADSKSSYLVKLLNAGILSINECRAALGYEYKEDCNFNVMQSSMMSLENIKQNKPKDLTDNNNK